MRIFIYSLLSMLMLLNLVACDSSQQGQAVNSSESSPLQVAEPKAVDEAKPQLQPGDEVVIRGNERLRPGQAIAPTRVGAEAEPTAQDQG